MKIFRTVSVVASVAVGSLSLLVPFGALAATTPSVGAAATYAVLSSTYTNTSPTTVTGDVGFTTGPAVAPLGTQANFGASGPYAAAGTDQNAALAALGSQACTFTFAPGAIDLATDTSHGTLGVYTPGVYCTIGAASVGTSGITLSGAGTYIFRVNGALTTTANSAVTLSGASSCDVFWTPSAATTLGANSTFAGTVIDAPGVTIGSAVNWIGRALAFGGTVTTNTDTLTAPSCGAIPPVVPPVVTPVVPPVVVAATTTSTVTTTAVPTSVTTVTTTAAPIPLPNAGFGPEDTSTTPWNAIVPAIALFALAAYFVARKRVA